jgi:hypothetical protein
VPTAAELFQTAGLQAQQVLAYVETPLSWSRSLATPPGLNPAIGATMRVAFDQMTDDPDFLADAARIKFEILPTSGERIQALVGQYLRTEPSVTRLVGEQIGAQTSR